MPLLFTEAWHTGGKKQMKLFHSEVIKWQGAILTCLIFCVPAAIDAERGPVKVTTVLYWPCKACQSLNNLISDSMLRISIWQPAEIVTWLRATGGFLSVALLCEKHKMPTFEDTHCCPNITNSEIWQLPRENGYRGQYQGQLNMLYLHGKSLKALLWQLSRWWCIINL